MRLIFSSEQQVARYHYLCKAVVAGLAGAGPLFWPSMLSLCPFFSRFCSFYILPKFIDAIIMTLVARVINRRCENIGKL